MSRFRITVESAFRNVWQNVMLARRRGEPAQLKNGRIALQRGFDPFYGLMLGKPFGKYDETIVRLERKSGNDESPKWFAPKKHANHIAIRSPYGTVIYIETTLDKEKRQANHPFDVTLTMFAEPEPDTLTLFDYANG